MKELFTRDEILQNVGCYSQDDAIKILKDKPKFTINEILSLDIPLKDKAWFICIRCELTDTEFRKFRIGCAWVVLPIFEAKYPENKAPREAIQAAEQYLSGTINIHILKQKRAAVAAAYASAASDAAYAAAYAAADAAADAAYAAAYASDAAAAAAAYASAAAASAYASDAAYAAAYASDAAYAAAYASDAAYAAAYASADAYTVSDAAVAAADTKYQDLLLKFFKSFTE
jgi:hypothetical protein